MRYLILYILIVLCRPVVAQPFPDVEVINANPNPGKYIARTMGLLEKSTTATPGEVRIMVYGQSITRMEWWQSIREYLQRKYPSVILNMKNYAIGGFNAERLIRCVERDVLDFYPDLIIFHDYGGEETYEKIIRMFRSLTTAEVLVLNDHIGIDQNREWHDRHSWEWLPAISGKYGLELVDVRTNWINFVERNGFEYQDLLSDHVHMNDLGNYLMAEIIKSYLVFDAGMAYQDGVSVKKIQKQDFSGDNTLIFDANRIDLVYPAGLARLADYIFINNHPFREFPAIYLPSRVYLNDKNAGYPEKIGLPVKIDLQEHLLEDHWEMVVKNVEKDGYRINFDVYSRLEGFQGTGDNLNRFCSLNGRICLEPRNWFYREEPGFFSPWKAVESGDTIRFDIQCLNYNEVDPSTGKRRQVIKGLQAGIHTLKITGDVADKLGEEVDIIVYDPPLSGKIEE